MIKASKDINNNETDVKGFIQALTVLRKRGGWYTWTGIVKDKEIKIKGYQTWLQIFKVDGIDYSNPMDQNVSEFKKALLRPYGGIVELNK